MIHLRYIVYKNPDTAEKQVAFWTDDVIHSTYARENGIIPAHFLSAGYMRPYHGRWVPYEHYQLDGGKAWVDKILVRKEFLSHTEFQTPELALNVQKTYLAEKKIMRGYIIAALKKLLFFRTRE